MVIFSVLWEDALISLELLPVIPILHEVPSEEIALKPTFRFYMKFHRKRQL
ncbi:MAG: hypothetical protein RLZZ338_2446 [Cyanobacteriota bacterium]|jgi:hypothetical protein